MKIELKSFIKPEKDEYLVIFTRKHWMAFIPHAFLSLIILVVPIVVFIILKLSNIEINIQNNLAIFLIIILSIYYLISFTFVFIGWITYYYDIYILTNKEIVDIAQEGLWGRKIAQFSLLRVQDVNSEVNGFFPTIFNYGNVLVQTAGEQQNFLLKYIPNPQRFSAKVLDLHQQLIENRTKSNQLKNTNEIKTEILVESSAPKNQMTNGEVGKDDLNKGGEVKF